MPLKAKYVWASKSFEKKDLMMTDAQESILRAI